MKKKGLIILLVITIVFITLIFYRYYTFTLEVNETTYFIGNLDSRIVVNKQSGKKTINVKFINDKFHLDISSPYTEVDSSQLYIQRSYSFDRHFFFMENNRGIIFSPENHSLTIKLQPLLINDVRIKIEGVIYNVSNRTDSLKISLKTILTE